MLNVHELDNVHTPHVKLKYLIGKATRNFKGNIQQISHVQVGNLIICHVKFLIFIWGNV